MPKRKAIREPVVDDSDLSPPPNDLEQGATALVNANAELETEALPAKRRKTVSSAVKSETTTNGTVAPTQKRATRIWTVKSEPQEEEAASSAEEAPKPAPKKRQNKAKAVKEVEAEEEDPVTKPLPKGRARKKSEVKEEANEEDNDGKVTEQPVKKKRKTKEEKEAEAMPLASRTVGHKLFIGAHVSSAGVSISIYSCLARTCNDCYHQFSMSMAD
jgi:hypothetical protein